jgi:predicted membrane protein
MDNISPDEEQINMRRKHRSVWTGIFLLGFGAVLLLNQLGVDFPWWMFKWYTFMIVLGLFIGAKHAFKDFGWLMVSGIGVVFLLQDIYTELPVQQFAWPVMMIALGLFIIFRPKKACYNNEMFLKKKYMERTQEAPINIENNDVLDIVSIFGSIRKNILSKSFRGGEIISVFGGAEVNLTQADIDNVAELEIVQIFGGTKLIIPSNWNVRSEAVSILGGVEDKRELNSGITPGKTLIIKGTTIFGGIDIVSYA